MNFGDRLRDRAAELELTSAELGRRAGIEQPRLRYYLRGEREPAYDMLGKLCDVLQTTPDWVLGFTEQSPEVRTAASDAMPNYIPLKLADVRPGMGGPAEAFGEGDGNVEYFPPALINSLRTKPVDLWVMQLEGNSMSPFLEAGDMVIVDSTKTSPSQPGAFVVWDGFGMVCKWVERILSSDPPKVRLISQNSLYKPVDLTIGSPGEAEAYIMGRVVWMSRKL